MTAGTISAPGPPPPTPAASTSGDQGPEDLAMEAGRLGEPKESGFRQESEAESRPPREPEERFIGRA